MQVRDQIAWSLPSLIPGLLARPSIVYYAPLHKAHIQMTFCPGTPNPNGSPEIANISTPTTLGPNNFMWRPLIETKSKEKL
jgi:hypothetical protein